MHQTLRLCGRRVHAVYGDWQFFFANGRFHFTHDVPEANCLPQEPPAKPPAKPAPKAAKPRAKPSIKSD